MQKISGILPSSSRLTSVDVKDAGAVRPGAPTFGRPVGESNLFKNSVVRSAHQAIQKHNELWSERSEQHDKAQVIQDMADSFFKSKNQMAHEKQLVSDFMTSRQPKDLPPTVSIPKISLDEPSVMKQKSSLEMSEEELNAPETGRYLDVIA
ncbi:MAG: hypothetical protein KDD58_00535 [Bdellovibrionales bacterium]|nr:hypothetical protein [Bdellovibrionales bacterium]